MATTYIEYDGTTTPAVDGTNVDFTFPFPYLKIEDVRASIDGVGETGFTINPSTPTLLTFAEPPPAGTTVRIFRQTDADATPSTFFAGSAIRAKDLNDNFDQILYIMQERSEFLQDLQLGQLPTGGLGTASFQDDSVTADKLRDDTSVDANRAVTTNHIRDNAITTAKLADNSVTTAKIVDANVTTAKIADSNITSAKLVDDIITTAKLVDSSVTTAKIADANVTTAKLATDSVTTDKVVDANITTAKLADSSVTTAKITDANVTTAKLVDGSVTEVKVATDAITTVKIVDANVTTAKLADANVTTAKLADGSVTTVKLADDSVTLAKLSDSVSTAIEAPSKGFKSFNLPYNTFTGSLVANSHAGGNKFGKGTVLASNYTGYRQGSWTSTDGNVYTFGNQYQGGDGVYTFYSAGAGVTDWVRPEPIAAQLRMPRWFHAALAGDSNEAKWLTDLDGVSLGYTNRTKYPKIINCLFGYTNRWYLTENGMLFAQGYGGYSISGNGYFYGNGSAVPLVVQFYDTAGTTALTGVNRPKIKQVVGSNAADSNDVAHTVYAVDTDGNVYSWGANGVGQVGDGSTITSWYAKQIDPVYFDNEPVIYLTCGGGGAYTSVYAITNTGRLFVWGSNLYGQLGTNDNVNKTSPVEATAVSGSGIQDKVITHVICTGGNSSVNKTVVMDSDGILYSAGNGEGYGVYLGRYDTTNTSGRSTFERLTDDTTTYLSDNQKAVSVWCTGGRYPTWYVITDGGTSNQPKVYSWGNNQYGQLARNANTNNTASPTVQGEWFLGECTFQDFGDLELNSAGTENVHPNETRDETMYASAWTNKHTFGAPVAVFGNNNASFNTTSICMLDSLGQLYFAGRWVDYPPISYAEINHHNNWEASNDYTPIFTIGWTQPEKITDWVFTSANEEQYLAAGESGAVYGGGGNAYYGNGLPASYAGFHQLN